MTPVERLDAVKNLGSSQDKGSDVTPVFSSRGGPPTLRRPRHAEGESNALGRRPAREADATPVPRAGPLSHANSEPWLRQLRARPHSARSATNRAAPPDRGLPPPGGDKRPRDPRAPRSSLSARSVTRRNGALRSSQQMKHVEPRRAPEAAQPRMRSGRSSRSISIRKIQVKALPGPRRRGAYRRVPCAGAAGRVSVRAHGTRSGSEIARMSRTRSRSHHGGRRFPGRRSSVAPRDSQRPPARPDNTTFPSACPYETM
jgi:hypothetical protein